MMQSKLAPCKKGDEIRDYEAVPNFPDASLACDAMLRGSNPSYRLHGINSKNVGLVQAPAASLITGEVVVNIERGKHGGVPLSAGVIIVVCISGIALLLFCLCILEIMSSFFCLRRRHSTSIFNRQDVQDDHSRAALELRHVEVISSLNPPEGAVQSNRSLEVGSSIAGSNDSQVAGLKQGLALWVIKGLPVIKYKKQKVLHPGLNINTNSASCVEFVAGGNVHRNNELMNAPAAIDHDMQSGISVQAIYNDAPDHNRLECVVCLSPFEEDEAMRVLPKCGHVFHAPCIDSWLVLHSTCPLCRVQISSLDVEHDAEPAQPAMS